MVTPIDMNRRMRRATNTFEAKMAQLPALSGDEKVRCDKCAHAANDKSYAANIRARQQLELAAGKPATQMLPEMHIACMKEPSLVVQQAFGYCSHFKPKA